MCLLYLLLKGNYMIPSTREYSLICSMSVYYTMDGLFKRFCCESLLKYTTYLDTHYLYSLYGGNCLGKQYTYKVR
uniref:Uncharacterized protein n=1 Tax=Myoviridae sp. ctIty1 TaxID=2827673 RepID=A0A8S5TGG9_9CAUD|nr:MAG TPA: hypothetical protein [Myoviridae sp. ctIty1]